MVVKGGRSQDETGYDDIGYESIDVGGGGVLVGIVAVDGDGVAWWLKLERAVNRVAQVAVGVDFLLLLSVGSWSLVPNIPHHTCAGGGVC